MSNKSVEAIYTGRGGGNRTHNCGFGDRRDTTSPRPYFEKARPAYHKKPIPKSLLLKPSLVVSARLLPLSSCTMLMRPSAL